MFTRWPRIVPLLPLAALLIVMSACALEPATEQTPSPTLTTTHPSETLYVTGAETSLRQCPERSCAITSVAPGGISLPIVTRHDKGSDYWLEVEYDSQSHFIGPFIMVGITYSSPPGTARTCPNRDCPVRFNIPLTDHVLSLDVIVTNLVEHWTQTVYNGEVVYLGPWIPPPSNSVWETTAIPASETARALGTLMPNSTQPSAAAATLVLTPPP